MTFNVWNKRHGNRVIHLTRAPKPKHTDRTFCGIQMKGKRWSLMEQPANCAVCLGSKPDSTDAGGVGLV